MKSSTRTLRAVHLGAALITAMAGCASHPAPHPASAAAPHAPTTAASPTSAQALVQLKEGNQRFASGQSTHPRQSTDRRAELAASQHPIAVVLGCADSRAGPEMLFDQGLGDLFVIRVAGNVIDSDVLGSVEYAVDHLHVPLVIVLGHERCGAIAAAREVVQSRGHAPGHIASLVATIRPAVDATVGQDAEETCRANVGNMVRSIRISEPTLRPMVTRGEVTVLGAYYDLDTGLVSFLELK